MKKIETLVEDVYDLFTGYFVPTAEDVQEFGARLAKHIHARISEERAVPRLRLSNLGSNCDRKLWYSIRTPDNAEPLKGETRLKFLAGDIWEELLLFLAQQAGHTVEGQQDELDLYGVKGHRDAVIDGVLVDVKSASSRSFDKFTSGLKSYDDSFGYLTQLQAYTEASGMSKAAFLVVDKTLGKLCLDIHEKKTVNWESLINDKRSMLASNTPPPRDFSPIPDGASGNMKLGMECSYCSFKKTCFPGVRTFLYSNGPRFLTTVSRLPDVPEA